MKKIILSTLAITALATVNYADAPFTQSQWEDGERDIILTRYHTEVYGCVPARNQQISYRIVESSDKAVNGKATRKQIVMTIKKDDKEANVDLLLYVPNTAYQQGKAAGLFMGLNFQGNQAISDDPAIRIAANIMERNDKEPRSRGAASSRWPIELIIDRGYAVATMARGDIALDGKNNLDTGILPIFGDTANPESRGDNFATISAWAWSLSRALDYLITLPEIDHNRIAVVGHSRLGKTALWAGANDTRFRLVISNDSGEGGAALFKRQMGETIADLNRNFPYWFCKNFQKYVEKDKEMPFDQDQLMGLIAPRHVYVASASEDAWADPEGEFLSLKEANKYFEIYGIANALPADSFPAAENPISGHNGYHLRSGKHDITAYDWTQYLNFADKQLK